MLAALLLSACSGAVWGILGFWLVRDTNMATAAPVGLAAAPAIGLLIGAMAFRMRPVGTLRRGLLALAQLYVAVGLFAVAVSVWQVTMGWDSLPLGLRSGDRASAFVTAVVGSLVGFTISGWVLWLWPISIVNHMVIWRRSSEGHV